MDSYKIQEMQEAGSIILVVLIAIVIFVVIEFSYKEHQCQVKHDVADCEMVFIPVIQGD